MNLEMLIKWAWELCFKLGLKKSLSKGEELVIRRPMKKKLKGKEMNKINFIKNQKTF